MSLSLTGSSQQDQPGPQPTDRVHTCVWGEGSLSPELRRAGCECSRNPGLMEWAHWFHQSSQGWSLCPVPAREPAVPGTPTDTCSVCLPVHPSLPLEPHTKPLVSPAPGADRSWRKVWDLSRPPFSDLSEPRLLSALLTLFLFPSCYTPGSYMFTIHLERISFFFFFYFSWLQQSTKPDACKG